MANSLKDMISSVDWRKMLSSQDAKNALIGSALGGLMLGGAGLMADRDPEESRLAPVGDALMGALFGGLAGYGIPKGLAMFRDAGSLAPDNDRLRQSSSVVPAVLGGAGGVALGGAGAYRALRSTARSLARQAATDRSAGYAKLRGAYDAAPTAFKPYLERQLAMYGHDATAANKIFDDLLHRKSVLARSGQKQQAWLVGNELKELRALRNKVTRGYSSFGDLVRLVGVEGDKLSRPWRLTSPSTWGQGFKMLRRDFWSPKQYHTGRTLWGRGPRLSAGVRMGTRAGKYGLALALLAGGLHKALAGRNSQANFKE